MRVLLAVDGSASSDAARELVASIGWPEGTCIRVVAIVEPVALAIVGALPYRVGDVDESETTSTLRAILDQAEASLEAPGRGVESRLLRGRAASVIVEEATEFRAELIVVGSRGLGRLEAMLLGSVSAEVVDHAPCPVLVARGRSIGRVLLAVDGSASARLAVDHLAGEGHRHLGQVEVMTVAPRISAPASVTAMDLSDAVLRSQAEVVAESRGCAEGTAAAAAEQLIRDGFAVRWSISTGDAAHEIIEAASSFGCDLVVMGSRGLTGLQRILLGSVARNVLLHTRASVLIVREPIRARLPERRRVAENRRAEPTFAG